VLAQKGHLNYWIPSSVKPSSKRNNLKKSGKEKLLERSS